MNNNITTVRQHLLDTLADLRNRDNPMEIERARDCRNEMKDLQECTKELKRSTLPSPFNTRTSPPSTSIFKEVCSRQAPFRPRTGLQQALSLRPGAAAYSRHRPRRLAAGA
jgi:hypothetical protein